MTTQTLVTRSFYKAHVFRCLWFKFQHEQFSQQATSTSPLLHIVAATTELFSPNITPCPTLISQRVKNCLHLAITFEAMTANILFPGCKTDDNSLEGFAATQFNDIFPGQTAASRCEGNPSHLDAAVCPGKFNWMIIARRQLRATHRMFQGSLAAKLFEVDKFLEIFCTQFHDLHFQLGRRGGGQSG